MSRRRGQRTPPPTKSFWQRYQWYIMAGVALFFIISVVVPALSSPSEEPTTQNPSASATRTAGIPGEIRIPANPSNGRTHVPVGTRVTYSSNPPTSGPHWSEPGVAPVAWGIYSQPIADEALVHNLEHGGIVIHYRDSAPPILAEQLKQFVLGLPGYPLGYVLAPRANHPNNISVSAWEYHLLLAQFDETVMRNFIEAHYDQGPESLTGLAK